MPKSARHGSIWCGPVLLAAAAVVAAAETPDPFPAPLFDSRSGSLQTAVLAGGCFWGIEGVFEHVRGVQKVVSGYSGGDQKTADYQTVSRGRSGHAEAVQI